ncbi:MFS transporter [Actomonas aquatica]|uniref:MFS transporter n=1 Tax=Actomonas aquatica TaxID=2866162 RepID=A0ABZ1C8A8_9BACT|nr:MFS transporter [Opitutus sp. WL0086]WRQ87620.1 MFS transporter [Opitutus sp. WL0086]
MHHSQTHSAPSNATPVAPLLVVAGATMLALIVFTQPLTTLAASVADLGSGPGGQAWILSGMPLGAAAGLLGAGALGDNLGRKRVFLSGVTLLVIASIVAALAWSTFVLVAARVVQGLASSALLACGLGLIGQVYPHGPARVRAAGIWAAGLGAGVAIGPIIAAGLLSFGGWRASHAVVAILATPLALSGRRRLPETVIKNPARVDYAGSVVLMVGMGAFLAALTEMRLGFRPHVIWLFAAGVILLCVFVWIEVQTSNPILQLSLFTRADFVGATTGAFASGAGVLSIMTLLPTVLERSLGVSPLLAAVVLIAWSAMTVITALAANRLHSGLSPRALLLWSMFGCGVGQVLLWLVVPSGGVLLALPGLLMAGISNGFLNAALGHQAVQTVPQDRTAMGSAANNTARYLGSAIGITIAAVLIAHGAEVHGASGLFSGWRQAILVSVAFTVIGIAIVFFARSRDLATTDAQTAQTA